MIILIKCGLFLTLALLLAIPLMATVVDLPAKAIAGQRLKTIIVNNYQPYTFMNDKGEPDGFSVDIARAVTRAMDIELEIRADKWDVAMKALEAGSIDLLPMMAQSPERDILFDFSVPHTIAYDAIFIKKGTTGIQSLKDLSGKTVIVMNRDIAHSYLLSSGLSETMKIALVDSLPEALEQLAAGKGDAAIMPKLVGIITAKKLTLSEIETLPQLIVSYTRPFSFAVKDGNQALLERLNQGLNIIKSSGEYDTIYKKWFGALKDPHLNLKTAVIIGAVAVVILLGFVVWNVMLKREVKAKTEHLLIEIADHKRAEEEKEELAQRFKLAVSSARLGVWDWNVRLNTMEWDTRMFELYGIMQKTSSNTIEIWMNGLHPEDRETAIAECQAALKGEKEFDTVFRVLHPDGTVKHLKASALVIQGADGTAERMIGINSDITEHKQAENILRKSEEKYRNLFNNSEVAIFRTRLDGSEVLDVNQKFLDMLGKSREETIGKPSEMLWVDPKEREQMARRLLAEGRVSDFEYKMLNRQGEIRNCITSLVLYREQGILEGSILDITERKQYEQELQQKNAELERFTYTVSHDLKSPIITIKGFTGSLEKDLAKGNYERMASDLKRVSAAADKMNDLLHDLLELSTIGRIIKEPETVDMNLLVTDVLAQLAGSLEHRNLNVAVQPNLPEVLCDKRRMAEVLQNLLENAFNYMGDQPAPFIQLGMREDNDVKVFFVKDNGIGIDEKYHKIIFGLFNKLDANSEGTGIGLALVKRIVEVHGGRVWVESDGEGKGSRFCFTIKEAQQ